MKLPLLCTLLAATGISVGQIPEPQTVAEDFVQRRFPIEAARILGWLRTASGSDVGDVKWTLEKSGAEGSTWKTAWLDASGKVIRERTVTVAAARLGAGAGYYRDVLRQLAGDDWALGSAPPDNAATAFWQGGDLAESTRVGSLTAAAKLMNEKPKVATPAEAARLSGALVHGALPSLAATHPLDAALLARGAAWLVVAELRLREPIDAAWAPILFLAGRKSEATELWQSPAGKIKLRSGSAKFWDLILRQPKVGDVFKYAARGENRAWTLPALQLSVRLDARVRAPAEEVARALFGDDSAAARRDYPLLPGVQPSEDAASKRLAGEFPAPVGKLPPVPVATRAEIELVATSPAQPHPADKTPARLAELTDESIATLAKDALASASAPAEPEQKPRAPTAAVAAPDFTDADTAWRYLHSLRKLDRQPDSPEDGKRLWRERLQQRRSAAEKFAAAFPQDPRRWDAVVSGYVAAAELSDMGDREAKKPAPDVLDQVIAAPDASAEAKGEAAFFRLMLGAGAVSLNAPHTVPPFQRALADYIAAYPQHPRAAMAANFQLQIISAVETPGADKYLADLAAHPNEQVASAARRTLDQRTKLAELRTKPLDLKFTAADGRAIDAVQLRGKIVLLDFWASWCGPCIADAPNVVAAYDKYRDRGFEIIGINLDQDKAAMTEAAERLKMPWPQHFDGKGWENEVAQRFGIRSIPSTWLFDQKGVLRQTGLRGEELGSAIERILRGE